MNKRPGRKATTEMAKQVATALGLDHWHRYGKGSIEAMREPTAAMLASEIYIGVPRGIYYLSPDDKKHIWQALIDEALT